jgi:hypothetical protein
MQIFIGHLFEFEHVCTYKYIVMNILVTVVVTNCFGIGIAI